MSIETIAVVCAGLGVVGSIIFWVLLGRGVKSLHEIRRLLRGTPGDR